MVRATSQYEFDIAKYVNKTNTNDERIFLRNSLYMETGLYHGTNVEFVHCDKYGGGISCLRINHFDPLINLYNYLKVCTIYD